jgi:hypothetical protein
MNLNIFKVKAGQRPGLSSQKSAPIAPPKVVSQPKNNSVLQGRITVPSHISPLLITENKINRIRTLKGRHASAPEIEREIIRTLSYIDKNVPPEFQDKEREKVMEFVPTIHQQNRQRPEPTIPQFSRQRSTPIRSDLLNREVGGVTEFISDSHRKIVDASGDGSNNCAFNAILYQVKRNHTRRDVNILRKVVGLNGNTMFWTTAEHMQKVANYFKRPMAVISRQGNTFMDYRLVLPNRDWFVVFGKSTIKTLSANFLNWITKYTRENATTLTRDILKFLPAKFDIQKARVYDVILALQRHPKTIVLVHGNVHFMAAPMVM